MDLHTEYRVRRALRNYDEETVREILGSTHRSQRDYQSVAALFEEERRGRERLGRIRFGDTVIRDRLGVAVVDPK